MNPFYFGEGGKPKALEGIRILDLSRMYGGSLGTMILTEGQESYRFIALNRGKQRG